MNLKKKSLELNTACKKEALRNMIREDAGFNTYSAAK